MFCSKCGKEVRDEAVICPYCGCAIQKQDTNSAIGYGIIGFLIPIVGLTLFIIYKDNYPKRSKTAGIGAIIGFALGLVGGLLYTIITFATLI